MSGGYSELEIKERYLKELNFYDMLQQLTPEQQLEIENMMLEFIKEQDKK